MDERKPWQQLRKPLQLLRRLAVKPPAKLRTWQLTAVSAAVGLVVAAVAIAAAGPWDSSGQRTAERDLAASREAGGGADHAGGAGGGAPNAAPSAPSVLAGLGRSARKAPDAGGKRLADVLRPLMDDEKLGPERSAVVVDVATGERLYGKRSGRAMTPASTTKIATAVAALSALGPDHRLTTKTVIRADSRDVFLVGGGDPTLTARGEGRYVSESASLRELADDTAKALKKRGADRDVSLSYDTSRYSGPPQHPIGPNENIAPVSALMADEGRLDDSSSGPAARTAEPARDAAHNFANLLRERGIVLTADPKSGKAPERAAELARTRSQPLSALVERMLTHSDNDIAEALARETAVAGGEPASFDGAAKAVRARLDKLGLPLDGAKFADGSGLDRDDRLSARLLAALLKHAAGPGRPELRSVVTGLPVAGFTGTLVNRYPDASAGTGVVRAKTGTLTGVNSLAGTVVDPEGRLLAFAFMTTGTTDPQGAQSALDAMASALAGRDD
ncbi:D-alanyl-D-alanine carboxypeptidase/D-alanyl-D-alanine endopeptidase [Streptomyces flavofungini]|uniref:D-alanyl-D-alanine carboxypeptidase/D-alanyl-D-alanine endopeptidase n=1 Tax=Streptomyces flavofungini TaxID=68200 RepID=UPI0025B04CC1|nr:D-alanyl-D-alanine carboxypeptidase/D-alanyl-D-alanine-endopeptidase [Streptomyces flavofungini]WJV47072.1 D-alanyl-D-alanine carboxypeptidase/D-alanyl-D-alanine-endopeptidase [Streptomyces flavofungini]